MSCLRLFIVLLTLLIGGVAQASIQTFDSSTRVSDAELDRMRGGFVVSWNGLDFMMPFSITGIERLTQIGNQTYINGELISPRLNPQALTTISQTNQISVSFQAQVPVPVAPVSVIQPPIIQPPLTQAPAVLPVAVQTPLVPDPVNQVFMSQDHVTPIPVEQTPAAQNPVDQIPVSQAPVGQAPVGQTPVGQTPVGQTPVNLAVTPVSATSGVAGSPSTQVTTPQVTTNGSLIVIQNGTANTVVLPPQVSLNSLATYIQNSVNNQVIRNLTILNITIEAQKIAAQARLSAILNQRLGGLP